MTFPDYGYVFLSYVGPIFVFTRNGNNLNQLIGLWISSPIIKQRSINLFRHFKRCLIFTFTLGCFGINHCFQYSISIRAGWVFYPWSTHAQIGRPSISLDSIDCVLGTLARQYALFITTQHMQIRKKYQSTPLKINSVVLDRSFPEAEQVWPNATKVIKSGKYSWFGPPAGADHFSKQVSAKFFRKEIFSLVMSARLDWLRLKPAKYWVWIWITGAKLNCVPQSWS